MRRLLAAVLLFVAGAAVAENRQAPLTRGLADSLYCHVAGTCTVQNFTITGTCTGCGDTNLTGPITSVGNATSIASQTGTGTKFVVDTSPTLVTPILGIATATSINGLTITPSTGTFTLTNAKTFSVSNSLTLAGTDSTVMTFPVTSATIARSDAANTFTGTQTFGAVIGTTWNGNTWATGTGTLSIVAGKTLTVSNSLTVAGTDATTHTFPSTSSSVARIDAGQTFTGNNQINGNLRIGSASAAGTVLHAGIGDTSATAAEIRVDSGSGATAYSAFGMRRNGVDKAYIATVGATDQFIPGSAIDDLTIRAQKILWSANVNGTPAHMTLTTTGLSVPAGTLTVSGHLTFEGVTSTGATGTGKLVFDTSPTFATSAISPLFRSTAAKVLVQGTGTGATQLAATQTTAPTCSSNCGTSPSVAGTDTAGIVTMGGTGSPASGWIVTFNGTWAAAPACVVQSALAGMLVTKMPIVVATTTTTFTVTTNGVAPANSDKYSYICIGTQ